MATVCTPTSISSAATCFKGYGIPLLKAMQIVLICKKLNGDTMNCDPDTLADEAKCYLASMTVADMEAAIVFLLCELVNA